MTTSMNISLPQPLKTWVEKQMKQKGYSTASEFVRDILRREQMQEVRARVDQKLIAALESGPPVEMDAEDWAQLWKKAKAQSAKKRRP